MGHTFPLNPSGSKFAPDCPIYSYPTGLFHLFSCTFFPETLLLASYGETGGFEAKKTGLFGAVWIEDIMVPWCAEHIMQKRQKNPRFPGI